MKRRFVLALLFVLPLMLSAQTVSPAAFSINMSPAHPRPGELVNLEAETFSVDLNAADISWSVDGKVLKKGIGQKTFSVVAGSLGSATKVSVTASEPDGYVLAQEVVLRPAQVDLLWQANSYTPPFYKGKALLPFQGTALIAAVPRMVNESGKPLPASSLIYTWKEGDNVIGDSSGHGKNLFVIKSRVPIRPKPISVLVETTDGELQAESTLVISPVQPKVTLYENHPLYGIRFNKANNAGFSLIGDEMKVSAVPFYFETPRRNASAIAYRWSLNFAELPQEKKADIVLRRSSEEGGTANIALEAEQTGSNYLQVARAETSIVMTNRLFELFSRGAAAFPANASASTSTP